MKVDDLVAAAVANQHEHGALPERDPILDQRPHPRVDLSIRGGRLSGLVLQILQMLAGLQENRNL